MNQAPGTADLQGDGDEVPAAFFDGAPDPGPDEGDGYDEWSGAGLTSRTFAAERALHLGGPAQRVVGAMPARTVSLKRRAPVEVIDESQFPRAPSDEERARTARRNLGAYNERVSPAVAMAILGLVVALLTVLVFLFGNRLFG